MNKASHCWRCEAHCTQQCSRCRVAFYCSKECQKQDKWRHEPDCDDAALKMKCLACGVVHEGMKKCVNCLEAVYCSVECQRSHWPRHRPSCQTTVERVLKLVEKLKTFSELKEKTPGLAATYYWGNQPAVDMTQAKRSHRLNQQLQAPAQEQVLSARTAACLRELH